MLFKSIYLKTVRDFRIAILGWGIGMGLLMFVLLSAIPSLIATPQAREALVSLAGQFQWLAAPVAVDTVGGYATWKYGTTILIVAIWALLAGSRMLRGEEERGSMDSLLSLPRGRVRIALEKLAAVWTALLLIGVLITILTFAGAKTANAADIGLGASALFALNIVLICGVFASIALFLSQFTQERGAAAGITGGLLVVFIVLDMVHRVVPNTTWVSAISPIYYYNLSKPLIPSSVAGGGTNAGGMLVMLAISVVLSGIAILLFVERDIGAVSLPGLARQSAQAHPERALPVNSWSLQSVYTRGLRMILVPTLWWTLIIAGFAAFMVEIVKQVEAQMASLAANSPLLSNVIGKVGGGNVNANATLLSFLFVFLPLLLMAFTVTQANRWSADEEDGRLELVLATPQPRLGVILGRFAALTTGTVFIGVVTLAATAAAAAGTGLKLDGGNLTAATLSLIPLGLLMAALGYLLSGWLRTAVDTGLLSILLAIWFFISFVGPDLNWSSTVLHLSAFYYYGTPILHGLPLGDMLGILAVCVVALVLASLRFVRKDIGR
jgi:ABC-2 type transport system permease protein